MKKLFLFLLLPLLGVGCLSAKTSVSTKGGLWESADAGNTWTSTSVIPTPTGLSSFSSVDMSTAVFDAADPDALYVGTVEDGMLFSYDNGASWQLPGQAEVRTGHVYSIAVDPRNKCTIYVALDSHIMKSTDCNRTFDTETFVESAGKAVRALKLDWYTPNTVWAATAGGDILKSVDAGAKWTTVERVNDKVVDLIVDRSDSRILIVVTEAKGLWRSSDGGDTWTQLDKGLADFKSANVGYAFTQNSDGSLMYYANKYGILRSQDHGATWSALTLLTAPGSTHIYALATSPDDGNVIYYGTDNTFYATTDGGSTWATQTLPSDHAAAALAIDPNKTANFFLGVATLSKN